MAIHIENVKNYILNSSDDAKVQSIPFKISADCDAKVSKYFESSIKFEDDKSLKASFRGYPLRGQSMSLPTGYVGVVLHESIVPTSDTEDRKFHVINKFKTLRYWNWDKNTGKNDKIVQALEWIDIAEVLHSPITEE
ncbi:hypothetical protein Zmor_006671 [Zophobas morio]|uniref:Uncharacterized protein n=1 Tax=Zophobas morio TaxID=2755281 RepID=A0AA38MMW2_9CUCU|nr:hypothetical protein Zmor_006671 [Zophobas morio]